METETCLSSTWYSEGRGPGALQVPCSGGAVDFDRVYQMSYRRVRALCVRMVGDTADAEDLTQEAFFQLFRKINTFRGESAFTTWLHRLVVNVVLMRFRRKSLGVSPLGEDVNDEDASCRFRPVLGADDTALTGTLERLNLERAIAQLPAGYRQVFELHDVKGYGHCEIGRMLGLSPGTSKSQLHKARLRLRDLLGPLRPTEPRVGLHPQRRGCRRARRRRVAQVNETR